MLGVLKRLFSGAGGTAQESHDWEDLVPWAHQRQYGFRPVPDEGFVVDGRLGASPWRLEWGPSQRPYIAGHELRIRAELGLSAELQVVVMNVPLQEQMEKDVFEQYVEGVQTRIDNQTPPEMRWLVMFPRLDSKDLGQLADRYVALSSLKPWLLQWLAGPLAQSLAALRVEAAVPMVLMIGRGRLMLRTALADPELPALQAWLRLFETAMREAQRVAAGSRDANSPSLLPGLSSTSALPGDERSR
ncbi:MAG: hypothetical protein KA711_11655 [Ideonella sp. WA131b]|jgi:hypothetical protein|nr:hypothetical protein [Ideonella sp. WA131b]